MKRTAFVSLFLAALVLLYACAGPITAEEAAGIAAEHLQAEYEGVEFRPEEAACAYQEFDDLCCYFVDIPGGQHTYRVGVDADSGEVIDVARCK